MRRLRQLLGLLHLLLGRLRLLWLRLLPR